MTESGEVVKPPVVPAREAEFAPVTSGVQEWPA